jgi:hypothetical protein
LEIPLTKFISRSVRLMALTAVATVGATVATVPTANASTVSATTYHIKALHSALALTVESLSVGAKVYQENPVANNDPKSVRQRWRTITHADGTESYQLNAKVQLFPGGPKVLGCLTLPSPLDNSVTVTECRGSFTQVWAWHAAPEPNHYEISSVSAPNQYWQIEAGSKGRARLITGLLHGQQYTKFRWVDAGA